MRKSYTGFSCPVQDNPALPAETLQAILVRMWNIHKKIRYYREKRRLSYEQVAQAAGCAWQSVQQWENEKKPTAPQRKRLPAVANVLGTTAGELLSPEPPPEIDLAESRLSNVEPGPEIRGKAPLISWVKAGQFSDSPDNYRVGDAEDWLPLPKRAGPNTYCLRVDGDSMTAPYGKSYPKGSIIFVDPDQRSPANGQRVIAKLAGSPEVTFKVFARDGDKVFLKPLNPQYPPMHEEFRIIGVVVGKWEDE